MTIFSGTGVGPPIQFGRSRLQDLGLPEPEKRSGEAAAQHGIKYIKAFLIIFLLPD